MVAPCLNCTDRIYWCHGMCREYMAFRSYKDAEKNARYAQLNKNGISIDSQSRNQKRNRNPNSIFKTNKR